MDTSNVLDAVRRLMRIRDAEGKAEPRITIRYALMRKNIEELPAAVEQWGGWASTSWSAGIYPLRTAFPRKRASTITRNCWSRSSPRPARSQRGFRSSSSSCQALRRTVNRDDAPKLYPYCGRCENRYGWGSEVVHLGDLTWLSLVAPTWFKQPIDHARPDQGGGLRRKSG